MAVYNEIQVGRYVRFLQKFLSIKGRQPAPLAFSGELGAVWPMFHGVENRYLEGWQRYSVGFNLAASVGNTNNGQLRNPSGSNVIAVLEKVFYSTAQTTAVQFQVSMGAIATDFSSVLALSASRMDSRGQPVPTLIFSTVQQAAQAPALGSTLAVAFIGQAAGFLPQFDLILDDDQEITLLPGDGLRVTTVPNNLFTFTGIVWRERIMEESERT